MIAFEDYRLRRQVGENPAPADYDADSAWTSRPRLSRKGPWYTVILRAHLYSPACPKETETGPDSDPLPHSALTGQTLIHGPARPGDTLDSPSSKSCEPRSDRSANCDELRTLTRDSVCPRATQ